ncbi:MAG: hypothetical protein ABI939_09020 [Anaerolineaceae bacterium]
MKKSTSRPGFVMRPALLALMGFFVLAVAFLAARPAAAQDQSSGTTEIRGVYRGLSPVVKFDISPPLREMRVILPGPGQLRENEDRDIVPWKTRFAPELDPVVQATVGGKDTPSGTEIPGPLVTFNAQANSSGVVPPDPNGAVGPNHIVAMCNLSFQIFNKTGTSVFGPAANNTLWAGFGGSCQTSNSGDPVVLYDRAADRWLLSQFTATTAPFLNCVAISTTNDPTGSYFRYAFKTGTTGANFPDYPKYGVWPDAYYLSTREFAGLAGAFQGVGAYALNRAQMLAGNPAPQVVSFLVPPVGLGANVGDGLLPSDLDGPTPPPLGSPNYFVGSQDNNGPYGATSDALNLYKFHVDFVTPSNSTFVLANTVPVASFNSILGLCGGTRACIPQPGTASKIDHLGYRQRPLFRLAYRNFGNHESLVTNQSVSGGTGPNGEVSGIRWWELRSPNSGPVIFQQGTYAPGITDGIHRWMGSIAMDGQGNMALGYSSANGVNPARFPSVSYTGRLAGDPLGTLPQGEGIIIAGTGSQTTSLNRWGDYTSIVTDPTDDLTFWYVSEWVPVTSSVGWQLRVGSFKLATGGGGPTLVSAASRLTHGPAGIFGVNMPLTGTSGVEDRSATTYNAVFTFNAPVTSGQVTVLSGTATVGAITFSGNSMTAQLTGVTSAEVVTLHTQNINGDGQPHGDVPFGFLTGDADASRLVGRPDLTLVQGQLNQAVTSVNFREDVNADGRIRNADVNIVKTNKGHSIP